MILVMLMYVINRLLLTVCVFLAWSSQSQGMFSNTKVDCHVEASEDGRFVFAGLLRGSSEMLALDVTDLPRWGTLPTREVKSSTTV